MRIIAGIEEAGRGPVIGPMVMAGLAVAEPDEHKLRDIGARDSKLLSSVQREDLFDAIMRMVRSSEIIILSPQEIDAAVLSRTSNLNKLEAQTTIRILNKLAPQKAFIDCPSTNTSAYAGVIRAGLEDKKMEVVAEHKADVRYPVVSAASIIAKVTRDRLIEELKRKHHVDFGSGYPADPLTARFLRENFRNPKYQELFRKSWASYTNLLPKSKARTLGDF